MFWGGTVFTAGWIMRTISSYYPSNPSFYIAQTCLVLGGPPIYAAAEYNILGRLMYYLPMHSPLHPGRLLYFFIYLGAAVEATTAVGASYMATAKGVNAEALYTRGGTLLSIALVMQAAVECAFISMVALMHQRAARSRMLSPNVRSLCIMLYGTSTLVLVRCIIRAIESFATMTITEPAQCTNVCRFVTTQEWFIYVFEAVPMAFYTIWLNVMHPGRYLPCSKTRYLDLDGKTERLGPGWVDNRSKWETFADPFDLTNTLKGQAKHDKFWLQGDRWPVTSDGSFANGTATNTSKLHLKEHHQRELASLKEAAGSNA